MPGLFFHPGAPTEEPSFCLEEKSTQLQLRMGEVLVMVKACGLSAVDIQFLKVLYLLQNPHPVGREIAGIIKEVGPNVKFFKPNDEVVGILPLGCTQSGLSTLVAVHEHFIVPKPPAVSWDDAAGAVSEGLGAYTALHYLGHVTPRDIIIVADGALMSGLMLVQLAMHRGARVLATVLSAEEADFLRSLQPAPARVINLTESGSQGLHKACMEETAGLGADLVIDSGVCMFGDSEDGEVGKIHKHDVINLLAVGGRWVTKQSSLQLDPPDCHLLQMRGGSVCFLNTETWMLSCTQLGSFLHILREIMEKLVSGALWSRLEVVPLSKAVAAMQRVQHGDRLLKRVVRLD